MPRDFQQNLDKYAEVILKVGVNLQAGQRLLIGWPAAGLYGTPIELAPLVRIIARKAYEMGARLVEVLWSDDQIRLIRFQHAARDTFAEIPRWRAQAAIEAAQAGDALLRLSAEDPDLLSGQDPELIALVNATNAEHLTPFYQMLTRNAMNWSIATAPVSGWTEKLFPDLPADEAQARFWDALFQICRITADDPIAAWQEHVRQLVARSETLNRKQYAALHLTAPGTDLTIGLPKRHIWSGARMRTQAGIAFTANIPTEEVFTMPHAGQTEGIVTMSKPLAYGGALIEGIRMTFSGGRLTRLTADKGEQYLRKVLEIDEGARRLGEVALVPHSSPISQMGRLFYNTLIDENAASHIAVGRGFRFAVQNGAAMSDEEFAAIGGNSSKIHIDCMVGSGEMDVDGLTAEGMAEPLMRAGEWAFEV
ncbi:MAG: aminopeptidase [Anaerolineae bacterium]|nr:aminopeptidase [Anaerolineae bacterium]